MSFSHDIEVYTIGIKAGATKTLFFNQATKKFYFKMMELNEKGTSVFNRAISREEAIDWITLNYPDALQDIKYRLEVGEDKKDTNTELDDYRSVLGYVQLKYNCTEKDIVKNFSVLAPFRYSLKPKKEVKKLLDKLYYNNILTKNPFGQVFLHQNQIDKINGFTKKTKSDTPPNKLALSSHELVFDYIKNNPGVCIDCISENFPDFCAIPYVLYLVTHKEITVTKDGNYSAAKKEPKLNKGKKDTRPIVMVDDNGEPLDFSMYFSNTKQSNVKHSSEDESETKLLTNRVVLSKEFGSRISFLKKRFKNKNNEELTTEEILQKIIQFAIDNGF
jgi:hypothetical protein